MTFDFLAKGMAHLGDMDVDSPMEVPIFCELGPHMLSQFLRALGGVRLLVGASLGIIWMLEWNIGRDARYR